MASKREECWAMIDALGVDTSVREIAKRVGCHPSTAADAKATYREYRQAKAAEQAKREAFRISDFVVANLWRVKPEHRGAVLAAAVEMDRAVEVADPNATPPTDDSAAVEALDQIAAGASETTAHGHSDSSTAAAKSES